MRKTILTSLLLAPWALSASAPVTMEHNREAIPTYQVGPAEINPVFFTGRVYQGAEGYIYPYPLFDVLTDSIVDKEYDVLRLANEWVDIAMLPEIGGRIFRAHDLTNQYPFFYTQSGIKPALIGMLGAWLSGGVEWNVPDHHRATSYMPVDYTMIENPDGSKTVWVGETELRHRLKWSVGVTVHPGRSWVEAKVKVMNPTSMIQSMLYWANVSVHCNEDYQVIFPPDVNVGVDHHKVYFTNWPEGPISPRGKEIGDQSWWKTFTQGTRSIFAWGSEMEFLAGYDFGQDAGTVHVANRHVVPGKKFFLWGNNPHGQMWNTILSDKDGHYLELMVGAYSDNQPNYSWINPGEVREFSQIWYPIKGIKGVKNATTEGAVNFEPSANKADSYLVGFCSTTARRNARVLVKNGDKVILDKKIDIDPDNYFLEEVAMGNVKNPSALYAALLDSAGNVLVDYSPIKFNQDEELPKVIDGTKPVKDYDTVEELYLAGLRVDQFNNARLDYMDFYREALARDSMDARVNIEVGKHYLRQGRWNLAETHLQRALSRLSHDYTRVKNAEPHFYLGWLYALTGRDHDANNQFWAATWTPEFKHRAYYELALIDARAGDYAHALEMVNESLNTGMRDVQAHCLKAYLHRKLGQSDQAQAEIAAAQSIDPLDYWSAAEACAATSSPAAFISDAANHNNKGLVAVQELLEVACNYLSVGDSAQALALIDAAIAEVGEPYAQSPLVQYYRAYCLNSLGSAEQALTAITLASGLSHINQYPMRIEEVGMLESLVALVPDDAKLHYNLGNLLYYLGQKPEGIDQWLASADLEPGFATVNRNLGFAYGQLGDLDKAIICYDVAIAANPDDALLLTESDKLWQRARKPETDRLARLEQRIGTVLKHDDAVMRLVALYNSSGQYDKAIDLLDNRHFHLWEGGGEVHGLYADAHLLYGKQLLSDGKYADAISHFERADLYPQNLEVPQPAAGGAYTAKAHYLMGLAYDGLGNADEAKAHYQISADSSGEGWLSDRHYYRAMSNRKLGNEEAASQASEKLKAAIERSRQSLMDSYAKFGDADSSSGQSKLEYLTALSLELDGDPQAASQHMQQARSLDPSNLWAR